MVEVGDILKLNRNVPNDAFVGYLIVVTQIETTDLINEIRGRNRIKARFLRHDLLTHARDQWIDMGWTDPV